MTSEDFQRVLNDCVDHIHVSMGSKQQEYATEDCLHNFRSAAAFCGDTMEAVCWGFLLKHLTSIQDMCLGRKQATPASVREKLGDARNYLILLEAIFLEQTEKQDDEDHDKQ